jgi:hypothetical protein
MHLRLVQVIDFVQKILVRNGGSFKILARQVPGCEKGKAPIMQHLLELYNGGANAAIKDVFGKKREGRTTGTFATVSIATLVSTRSAPKSLGERAERVGRLCLHTCTAWHA